jgi:hypothetical protein
VLEERGHQVAEEGLSVRRVAAEMAEFGPLGHGGRQEEGRVRGRGGSGGRVGYEWRVYSGIEGIGWKEAEQRERETERGLKK